MKTIEVQQMWEDYYTRALPLDIPKHSVQYTECRKVFYAAVGQVLLELKKILGSPDVTDQEGAAMLQNMLDQVFVFLREEVRREHDNA
jgi:hypothetical protein